jgi:hypothetical protein
MASGKGHCGAAPTKKLELMEANLLRIWVTKA